MNNRALVCQYGKASRHFRIADVSNGDFEEVSPGFPSRGLIYRGGADQTIIDRIHSIQHD